MKDIVNLWAVQGDFQGNVISYSAAIEGCEMSRHWPQALHLLRELNGSQQQGNMITPSELAWTMFQEME